MAGNELRRLLFLALIFHMFNVSVVLGLPELGIEDIGLVLNSFQQCPNSLVGVSFKSMYKDTNLLLTLNCQQGQPIKITSLNWIMKSMNCLDDITGIFNNRNECPQKSVIDANGNRVLVYNLNEEKNQLSFTCSKNSTFTLPIHDREWKNITTTTIATMTPPMTTASGADSKKNFQEEDEDKDVPEPRAKPEKPGYKPEKPGTKPEKPGTKPDKPGTKPDKPETKPEKPGTKPDKPGTKPDKPGTKPDKPGTKPEKRSVKRAAGPAPPTVTASTLLPTSTSTANVSAFLSSTAGTSNSTATTAGLTVPTTMAPPPKRTSTLLTVPADGIYLFVLTMEWEGVNNVTGTIAYQGTSGYLSAVDWPLLPFYGVMLAIYIVYMLTWLVLCCYYRADILRIQYWIGGVILLGLLEKTVYVGEFHTLNRTGVSSVYGALMFGELVSCAKRTLSRMLVIIASVGFGIVRPRLGATLHKIMIVGAIYFLLAVFEGYGRITATRAELSNVYKASFVVISLVDVGVCCWIFSGLVETMRTLRIRRNLVKLSLYRHFTHTLIFSVLASFAYMIWSIKQHKFVTCLKDWKELWVDEAFWHLLFSILLLIIMILWRPSANNQRYAYSPLLDAEDQELEEPMINDAFEGIKLRQKSQENGSTLSSRRKDHETEDDLKWIEENIPTSLADSALPSLLDSDEELAATNYEISKMH